ncbi:ankyrin repeat protein [Tolypocladium capitatum]|uniref:Ankyrin repeat protein n=1 Tax=Tolypocladium capitatum TaxID=45235 RepID=A0A2K3QG58_9HYPO|nr:ankyrin repeat protein [Tolypocladium capitatum]
MDLAFTSREKPSVNLIESLLYRPGLDEATQHWRWVYALCLAARAGRLDVMEALLSRNEAGAGYKDQAGNTPLHFAAMSEQPYAVNFLLRRPGVSVNAPGVGGETAMHWAVSSSKDVMEALIHAGADIDKQSRLGSPLRHAVMGGFNQTLKVLLDHGADPSIPKTAAGDGLTLLHHFFHPDWHLEQENLDPGLLVRLIRGGAELDTMSSMSTSPTPPDPVKWRCEGTALFFAAVHVKEIVFMQMLLEAGARVDSVVIDRLAIGGRPQSFLAGLFRHEFNIYPYHALTDDEIDNELVYFVRDRMVVLLNHGARLDAVGGEQSALEYACEVACRYPMRHEVLWLLLWNSTSRNVSREHIEVVKPRYGLMVDMDEEQGASCRRIVSRLTRFIERVF